MSWSAPSAANVLSELTPDEAATIRVAQADDASGNPAAILARVVAEMRDFIRSGGYDLATDEATIPLGLHDDAIAITRWRWLLSLPDVKSLQTDARKEACERALKKLDRIADQKFSVEPPSAGTTDRGGNWNSENKLIMRTHPAPMPGSQFSPQTNTYANPSAPADNSPA